MKLAKNRINHRGVIIVSLLAAASAALPISATADDSVTAWADATTVVDAGDFRIAVGSVTLRCSPDWCTGGTNVSGAAYSLFAVTDPDTANAVTSAVPVAAATVEGEVDYAGNGYVRFIMKAEAGGEAVGDVLVQDVSFGLASAPGAAIVADSRAVSLQEAISANAPANVVYSSDWADGATAVSVSEIVLAGRDGEAIVTNSVLSASAVADGTVPVGGLDTGWYRLLYRAVNGSGETLLEYLTDEFRVKGGILLLIK